MNCTTFYTSFPSMMVLNGVLFYILILHYPPPVCGFWLRWWAWTGEYSLARSFAIHFVIPLCRYTFHCIQLHCYWSYNNSIMETKARDPSGRQWSGLFWGLNENRENVIFLYIDVYCVTNTIYCRLTV